MRHSHLAARNPDILQLPVAQVAQGGWYSLAFTPLLKRTPISVEKGWSAPRRCGRLPQPCCTIGCAHRGISSGVVLPSRGGHAVTRARLTFGLHFPHRRLILRVAAVLRPPTIGALQGIGSLRYLFEEYAFDTDRRELYRGADVVSVAPQVFDLLDYLIRNRERVVSKDDLINAIWNGRSFRCGADDPPECRPERNRRFRRGTAPHQNTAAQGLPLCRTSPGSAGAGGAAVAETR